jgi:Fe2+ transport system protein B
LKQKYETELRQKLQRETDRIETELRHRQTELRQESKEQTDRLLESETEKRKMLEDKVRSEMTLQITEAAKEAAEQKLSDRHRELERAYKIKFTELETQFETELSAARIKLETDFETETEAQKAKPFFEQKIFAVIVLLITMSIQMYEVALFTKTTLDFQDLIMPLFWGFAFQFGGLMMTIHIGNAADWKKSFLFWFSALSFVINLYVLLPNTEGVAQITGRILFAAMFPFIEFAYGKIYLKLK